MFLPCSLHVGCLSDYFCFPFMWNDHLPYASLTMAWKLMERRTFAISLIYGTCTVAIPILLVDTVYNVYYILCMCIINTNLHKTRRRRKLMQLLLVLVYLVTWASVQTHKRLNRTLFIMTKHNMRIFRASPFFKLQMQNNCKQQISGEKWDVGRLPTFALAVLLCCFGVHCLDLVLECWQSFLFQICLSQCSVSQTEQKQKQTNKQTDRNKQKKTP